MAELATFADFTEAQEAHDARTGLASSIALSLGLPYRPTEESMLIRRVGLYEIRITHAGEQFPFGIAPRRLLAELASAALISNSRTVKLFGSWHELLRRYGLRPTGGATGNLVRYQQALENLLSVFLSIRWIGDSERADSVLRLSNVRLAANAEVNYEVGARGRVSGEIELAQEFFEVLQRTKFPIYLDPLLTLQSAVAFDLLAWGLMRGPQIRRPLFLPWIAEEGRVSVKAQFGMKGDRPAEVRRLVANALPKVYERYPEIRLKQNANGLTLFRSPEQRQRVIAQAAGSRWVG